MFAAHFFDCNTWIIQSKQPFLRSKLSCRHVKAVSLLRRIVNQTFCSIRKCHVWAHWKIHPLFLSSLFLWTSDGKWKRVEETCTVKAKALLTFQRRGKGKWKCLNCDISCIFPLGVLTTRLLGAFGQISQGSRIIVHLSQKCHSF